jgi:ER-bound oxygenase mpaB/B'/Rubber oxygenase, catalytic domain
MNTAIPTRHGSDTDRARRAARLIVGQIPPGVSVEPTPAEWAQLGQGLLQGDPWADGLVAWMQATGMGRAWALVNQAIESGIGQLPDAPPPLRAFFEHVERRPDWVDDGQLVQGARVCGLGGRAGMRALAVTGLMAGYQLSAINQTLLATGALEKGAARRIAETTKWWIDVTEPSAMARHGDGFKGTLRVRIIHALVRHHVAAQPTWDASDLGVPVCQTDMQATYLGFSVVYLLGLKLIGVPLSRADKAAVMHLWRYIAWVNGVDERLLHDLVDGERSGMAWLFKNLLSQRMADADSARLACALADEPLQRHYPRWGWLMGRFNRAMQLSIARACMGNDTLRGLGLPLHTLPWYPLWMMAINQPLHRGVGCLPGGREWLMRRGRAQQRDYLPVLFGRQAPGLRDVNAVKVTAASGTKA